MNCRPVAAEKDWPPRDEIAAFLGDQLERMLKLFAEHRDRLAGLGPNTAAGWDLARGVIHGLHDEARHQGEMHLLLKLRR